MVDVPKIQRFINSDNKNTIRLMFPNLDFNSAYPSMGKDANQKEFAAFLTKTWDSDIIQPYATQIGSLAPHLIISHFGQQEPPNPTLDKIIKQHNIS